VINRDVPADEMPNFPWLSRQDVPEIDDTSLAALLAGAELPAGSPPQLRLLSETLAALMAPPASDELAGEVAAMAEFRNRFGVPAHARRSHRRRRPVLASLTSAGAAVAAGAAALSLGGFATAAFAGALPGPAQRFAHDIVGAPSAGAHPSPAATPSGPDATGPAAFGLCTAWAHAKADGTSAQQAVAFRKLAAAADGAGNIAAYCAGVPHPGTPSARHSLPAGPPTSHPAGPPSSHPAGPPTSHPAGPPPTHPTGPPTAHPTPGATGQPSSRP